jgi:putative peptide zinc metalloprotease protein
VSGLDGRPQRLWPEEEDVVPILAPRRESDADHAPTHRRPRPPRLTAADFTPERMLRPAATPPEAGWRRSLYQLSGGLLSVPPSAAELRRRELIAQVKTPILGCRTVAFVSRKGGVGKTTTCLLVGHTFASHRGDRVIAVDANPDAGTLGHRLRRETTETLPSLLRERQAIRRYADVRAYTSQAATRLEVIAGDECSEIDRPIGRGDVGRAVATLARHFNLLCLDAAAGVLTPANQGVLAAADQIVVVSAASLDTARAASATLDWLEDHGYEELAASAVAVVNAIRNEPSVVDLERIEEHFASRCRACIRIPWDGHLHSGTEVVLEEVRPETREAYLELAAAIARGFAELVQRRS